MTFTQSEQQTTMQAIAQHFAETKLGPIAADLDITSRFPAEIFQELADIGIMGVDIPKEYGGAGFDTISKILSIVELAKADASTAEVVSVHTTVSGIFLKHGTEVQKKKYLRLASTGSVGAFALTEPNAGSDSGAAQTIARREGDEYVINGTKCFISNMGPVDGDYVVLFALTQPEKGLRGMSAIAIDRGTPGFTVGKREDKMGMRSASVSELVFEDCRVPCSQLIGKEGHGFYIAMEALDSGRISMAAQALGLCDAAIEMTVKYVKEREQFGKPIAKFQGIQWELAEMAMRTEAARSLIYNAGCAFMDGEKTPEECTKLAAMAKCYASDCSVYVTGKCMQLHGAHGIRREYPLERMYRDARLIPIYEGTNEIQKVVISRAVIQ